MRIHLGGHLNWYDAQKRAWLVQRQSEPITLLALAQQLGLPAAEIAIVAVNGRAVRWKRPLSQIATRSSSTRRWAGAERVIRNLDAPGALWLASLGSGYAP